MERENIYGKRCTDLFYAQTCSASPRLGSFGYKRVCNILYIVSCMFVSTRSSIYMFSRYFLDKVKTEF